MGLIECPDCDGKVSDIAPTCPHCGRPFEQKKVELSANPNSQQGFQNSATESVFKLILNWIQLQKKILLFILLVPIASGGAYLLIWLLLVVTHFTIGWPTDDVEEDLLITIIVAPAVIIGAIASARHIFFKDK